MIDLLLFVGQIIIYLSVIKRSIWTKSKGIPVLNSALGITLPKTDIALKDMPSQKEILSSTIHFQGRTVSFREGILIFFHLPRNAWILCINLRCNELAKVPLKGQPGRYWAGDTQARERSEATTSAPFGNMVNVTIKRLGGYLKS